jgi:hypothetical protein
MKKYIPIIGLSVVIVLAGLIYLKLAKDIENSISFDDIEVEYGQDILGEIAGGYISLPTISADPNAVNELVGSIVIVSHLKTGPQWSYDIRFRPKSERIKTTLIDETLFKGIVSAKASFGGRFNITKGDLSGEELAETTVKNRLVVNFKDPSEIPFKQFNDLKLDPNKDYFFVQSVVVTDVTTRRFKKHSGGGKIEGMAFGADGSVFSEKDASISKKVVSFRPINISDIQTSESGIESGASGLAKKARSGTLTNTEADEYLKALGEKVKSISPISIPLDPPPKRLPVELEKLEPIVLIDGIYPLTQSSTNLCWAAATAMMFSWKTGKNYSEESAVAAIGSDWVSRYYKRGSALPTRQKLEFLNEVGFSYGIPQSYLPRGVVELLENHGPIWFTIGEQFSRHATLVIGIYQDKYSDEYWLSYIDPGDGQVKAATYEAFMNRYEEPAYDANEVGSSIAMTYSDLDIQVVHW